MQPFNLLKIAYDLFIYFLLELQPFFMKTPSSIPSFNLSLSYPSMMGASLVLSWPLEIGSSPSALTTKMLPGLSVL